ncbi:PITRM1.2 family protein [Megaselia abdita]
MKGAFSENSSIFGESLLNNILPSHTYGYVSGGNPLNIPSLTHQNLIDFHSKYYHPSNARIFAYGNLNLEKTLDYIDGEYFSTYYPIDNSYSRIPNESRWLEERKVHVVSRFDSMGSPIEKQNQIAIALLMADITDINETFTLAILSELLIKGPNSPFYKNLIEPNFSGGYNSTTGYESQVKDTFFAVGLQDLKVDEFSRFEEIFDKTIKEVIANGFESDHIESVLHNIELSLKHQSPSFGMRLLFNCTSLWNHDGDVVSSLEVSKLIQRLRKNLHENPKYLQGKVEQYFSNNQHRLTLTMSPDENYENNMKVAEKKILDSKVKDLTPKLKEEIFNNGVNLEKSQKAPVDNIHLLPCLALEDVQKNPDRYTSKKEFLSNIETFQFPAQTNEISYLKCLFNGNSLTKEEILLIPLFCDVITEMGTKSHDYKDFDKIVTSKISGFSFKLHFAENLKDAKTYNLGVLMTTHCLDKNVDDLVELAEELLNNFSITDVERVKMLIENYLSNLSVGVTQSGHLYAMQSAGGLVTDSAALKSKLSGIEHIDFMRNFTQSTPTEKIIKQLVTIGKKLFQQGNLKAALNSGEDQLDQFSKSFEKLVNSLPKSQATLKTNAVNLLSPKCQHHVMNIPVNYCAKAFMTVPYSHPDHPKLKILAKFLSAKYFLPVVREQNGAYGAGSNVGSDGIFRFFSYRDPHSVKTFEAFDKTYEWVKGNSKELNDQSLFEAKLGVLQQLDAPIAPGSIGGDLFLHGLTQDETQNYRKLILETSLEEVHEVVEKYFKEKPVNYGKCLLGPENELLKNDSEKWEEVKTGV